MRFKNITKKNIIILENGIKKTIKPKQVIDGNKNILGQYSGLLKINQVNRGFNEIKADPPIEIESLNESPIIDSIPIQIDEIIIDEKTESNLRKVSDIKIDFIIVDNIT